MFQIGETLSYAGVSKTEKIMLFGSHIIRDGRVGDVVLYAFEPFLIQFDGLKLNRRSQEVVVCGNYCFS